jgi:hypothetical protein
MGRVQPTAIGSMRAAAWPMANQSARVVPARALGGRDGATAGDDPGGEVR